MAKETVPRPEVSKDYVLASDFDQTLSFNDSGIALSELLGTSGFEEKIRGLARLNLVQQGGELAYLLLHDPEYRQVRREHLVEVGRRIRLKRNIGRLVDILESGIDGHRFRFYVVSAAPEEVVQSALEGLVPPRADPRHALRLRPGHRRDPRGAARLRRLRQGRRARPSSRHSCRCRPTASSTSATAARTCT